MTSCLPTSGPLPSPATSAAAEAGIEPGLDVVLEPHHDTGPSYLLGRRSAGATLTARVWVPAPRSPQQVIMRQVIDGEPDITEMTRIAATAAGSWWQGPVRLVNPVNHYRFLLLEPDGAEPYQWLHAAGLASHDVPDATDFRVLADDGGPQWVEDAVVYQVFPDRFASCGERHCDPPAWALPHEWLAEPPVAGQDTARAWYGGDLEGITERLEWLEELGVTTVYLTPVFPAGSVHRYDATTFDRVDPLLGGTPALERLSRALHDRGMRLVLDLTTNHTGAGHEWFAAAQADARSPEAGYYCFEQHPHRYASWMGVPSLPKLDHRSPQLRSRLLQGRESVAGRWLAPPVSADGWRVDVANMTGRLGMEDLAHQVAQDMRTTALQAQEDDGHGRWLVAEHGHDASGDLQGPGWHGTMNYQGFTRPLWSWLSDPDPADELTWMGVPAPVPHLDGAAVVAGMRQYLAQLPPTSLARSMNLLCSHDTARVRTVVGSHQAHMVAATALFTSAGVPMIFSGDELGARGRTGEHSRTTIPWALDDKGRQARDRIGQAGSWGPVDTAALERYRDLARMRRELVALRRGGTRYIHAESDMIVWLRTHPEGDVLVVLARSSCKDLVLPLAQLHARGPARVWAFDSVGVLTRGQGAQAQLLVRAHGPGSAVVALRHEE